MSMRAAFCLQAQQHDFNMPFQLACPGPDQYSDTCEDACIYELELEAGDVVVLATDGVLDNLWDDQMAQLVAQSLGVCCSPGRVFVHGQHTQTLLALLLWHAALHRLEMPPSASVKRSHCICSAAVVWCRVDVYIIWITETAHQPIV